MTFSRKLAVAFAATAAVFTLGAAPAQAAEGAPASTRALECDTGRLCMFEDQDYTGDQYNWKPTGVNQKHQIDGWNGDNEISSVINRTRYNIKLYDNDDYSGRSICLVPGKYINNLKNWWIFNDKAESAKTVSSC
ncbi:peptidase inhibitor family I36 protein [Streptomyces lanatus]|uniref:Peptidase inhibitor family I36 protein n=1 Tax=Streptomyces lanatus TaxID=66900 RepID=A0ABV1XSI6_9ACTN|nr:peptidase inhibitor family I36 protein [Streptomyces lanatus]GHH07477.1 hypothetical protein GCM10018780_41360 [Streptomyces lanatus]